MESADRFVFLVGPPGSGKTLLLGLKAEEWARAGCNVVIVRATGDDDADDDDDDDDDVGAEGPGMGKGWRQRCHRARHW